MSSRLDRRAFIATATTAALAGPFIVTARAQEPARKLGVALVGLGSLSTNQIAPALQKTKFCRLVGVVSGTPAKIQQWKDKYGIPPANCYSYEEYDRIKDNSDIDIICVVLPNSMHAEYTIRGARAGKHVFCEKPMANSAKDCEAMVAACREAKHKL